MTKTLPRPVAAYFDANNRHDVDGMLEPFAKTAIVKDVEYEDELRGAAAIRRWMEETTAKYRVTVEVLDSVESDGATVVTGRVSGNFPGSPADLRYVFKLAGGQITRLEITP